MKHRLDKKLYTQVIDDIERINSLDKVTIELRVCKTLEEAGELIRVVNKKIGRKNHDDTEEQIREQFLEEAADTVQCIYSSALTRREEGREYLDGIAKQLKIPEHNPLDLPSLCVDLFWQIPSFKYTLLVLNEEATAVIRVMQMAEFFDVNINQIHEKVLEKNIKWESYLTKTQKDQTT